MANDEYLVLALRVIAEPVLCCIVGSALDVGLRLTPKQEMEVPTAGLSLIIWKVIDRRRSGTIQIDATSPSLFFPTWPVLVTELCFLLLDALQIYCMPFSVARHHSTISSAIA